MLHSATAGSTYSVSLRRTRVNEQLVYYVARLTIIDSFIDEPTWLHHGLLDEKGKTNGSIYVRIGDISSSGLSQHRLSLTWFSFLQLVLLIKMSCPLSKAILYLKNLRTLSLSAQSPLGSRQAFKPNLT